MKQTTKHKWNKIRPEPIIIGALIACGVFGAYLITKQAPAQPPEISETTPTELRYKAEGIGISFAYPSDGVLIKDVYPQIVWERGQDKIVISRVDSMFDSLDTYLQDLIQKNHMNVIQTEQIPLSQKEIQTKLLTISSPRGERMTAFSFYDGWVYTFSVESTTQAAELRQLLESLKFE